MFSQIINNHYMKPSYKNPYYYINNVSTAANYPISSTPELITPSETQLNQFLIEFGIASSTKLTIVKSGISYTFDYSAIINTPTDFYNAITLQTALNSSGIKSSVIGTNLLINEAYLQDITSVSENSDYLTITSNTISDNSSLVQRKESTRYGNRSKVRMEIRYGKDNKMFELSRVYIDYLKAPLFIRITQDQFDEVEDNSQLLEFPDYVCQEITNELIKLLMENASDPRLQSNTPINQSIANPAQEQQQQPQRR